MMKVLAGIVVYRPDMKRLEENIHAVRGQVDRVVLFDNGGLDRSLVPAGVEVLGQGENLGIAAALNAICTRAEQEGYAWALTLDQDSVCPEGLIEAYGPYADDPGTGMLCPAVLDRGYGSLAYDRGQNDCDEVDACITSASLIRIRAWRDAGGFLEDLFIDMVDFDICWSLREHGWRIVRVNGKTLLQEIGHSLRVSLLGKEEVVFNHNPLRCYYMIRNTLAVGVRHRRFRQCLRWVLKRILLINLFEKDRCAKNRMMLRGWIDFRNKVSGAYKR